MKKFLLSLAAVLGLGLMANAETYTYTAAEIMNNSADNVELKAPVTVGGFKFDFQKNSGTTAPTYNANGKDFRLYAKGTLDVAANGANITAIEFTISAQGLKRFPAITASAGAIAEQGVNPLVWGGSSANVTFTVGDKATYGTEGESKAGQFDFSSVTITTDAAVTNYPADENPDTPDTPATGAIYEKATAMAAGSYLLYSSDCIAVPLDEAKAYGYIQVTAATVKNDQITTDKANAFEFIATDGGYFIKDSFGRYVYQTGTFNSFNVSADFKEDVDAACYVWAVEVADGAFKIKNTSVEKTIQYDTQYSSYGSYSDERGVYPVLYKYVKDAEGTPDVPQLASITNFAQLFACANNEKVTVDTDATVVYANGSDNYVCDAQDNYALIYKANLGLEAGQKVVKGWTAKVSIYNNLIELVPDDATLAATNGATVPNPAVVNATDAAAWLVADKQNCYVRLMDVVFDAATPAADANKDEEGNDLRNFTGTFGGAEVAFYQRFGVESVPAGTYEVVGFISVYKTNVQVYPIRFDLQSGVNSIATEAGAAEYYNLQGVKVANPAQGSLYIRVQGTKAEKVIF